MRQVPVFKTLLVCTNFAILSFLTVIMIDHIKANHNLLSWSSGFHVLCIFWLIMRGIFWFLTISSQVYWSNGTFYSLYWIPNPLQFAAFALLPLFFAQVVYPELWHNYWVGPVYFFGLCSIVAFQISWAILASFEEQHISDTCDDSPPVMSNSTLSFVPDENCFTTNYSSNAFRLIAAFLFVGLAIIQGIYGHQIALLEERQYSRYFTAPRQVLNAVNTTLFVSFLSRGLCQLLALFGLFLLPQIPLQGDEDVSFSVFFCFELWDYLPTILLVLTVTSRSLGTQRSSLPKPSSSSRGAASSEDRRSLQSRLLSPLNRLYMQSYGLLDPTSPWAMDATEAQSEEVELASFEGHEGRPAGTRTPVDHSSLDRFNPPSLSPSNSLLGQVAVGSSFTSSSWQGQQGQNSTGDAADPLGVDLGVGLALTIGPQESAADRSLLQGPGRPQRRRGNSLTEGGVGAAAAVGWQQHQQWVLDGSGQAQEKGPFVPLLTPSTSANSLAGAVDGGEPVFSALSAGIVKGLALQQQQQQQSNSPPRPLQVPQPVRLTAAPSQPQQQPQPQQQQQQTKLVQPQAQRIASIFPRREEDRAGDA